MTTKKTETAAPTTVTAIKGFDADTWYVAKAGKLVSA